MSSFKGRSIVSINDLAKSEILNCMKRARDFKKKQHCSLLRNKILASLFFEPSTRTRLSFESAMRRLGGEVVGFASANVSSAAKGESLRDTVKVVSRYADVIVLRHSLEGASRLAAESSDKPVINAGDGANQHPTQTLLDLFSIWESQGKMNNLSIAMVGDLKYGRTVHSLASALRLFGARLYFVAPDSLQMPEYVLNDLDGYKIKYSFHDSIESVINMADILYMTRIQKERFGDLLDYERVKDAYVLTTKHLRKVKKNMKVMHPLPRVNEIDLGIDATSHAGYFQQAENGLFVRQALLSLVLGKISI